MKNILKRSTYKCLFRSPIKKENIPEFFPQKIEEDKCQSERENADSQFDENQEIPTTETDQAPNENFEEEQIEVEAKLVKRRPSMQIVRKPSNESAEMKEESVSKQPVPVPRSSCPAILPSQIGAGEKEEKKRSASILEQSPFIKAKKEGTLNH